MSEIITAAANLVLAIRRAVGPESPTLEAQFCRWSACAQAAVSPDSPAAAAHLLQALASAWDRQANHVPENIVGVSRLDVERARSAARAEFGLD